MAIPQQNHAKSIHFPYFQVDWLLTAVFSLERRTPVVDAGPTREHHFFHPGCVIGTRMQSALQATARILWWSCWCFNVGYTKRSDGKSRIKWDLNFHLKKKMTKPQAVFTSTRARMGVFCYQLPRFFFYTSGGYETCNRTDRSDPLGVIVAWIWTWQQDAQSM